MPVAFVQYENFRILGRKEHYDVLILRPCENEEKSKFVWHKKNVKEEGEAKKYLIEAIQKYKMRNLLN